MLQENILRTQFCIRGNIGLLLIRSCSAVLGEWENQRGIEVYILTNGQIKILLV